MRNDPSFGQEWGPLIASAFAAIAAAASWAGVLLNRRIWRKGLLPQLQVQVVVDYRHNRTELHILNVGGGVAKRPAFVWVTEDQKRLGQAANRPFLQPGEQTTISAAALVPDDEPSISYAVAICRDARDIWHAWSNHGEHRTLRRGLLRSLRPTTVAYEETFKKFFPDIDLDSKRALEWEIEEEDE